jgi:hypothetical protein
LGRRARGGEGGYQYLIAKLYAPQILDCSIGHRKPTTVLGRVMMKAAFR